MSSLTDLQSWYLAQCDGDWEHQYGVNIETLDNPGWHLKIALTGTAANGRKLDHVKVERTESDWAHYRVDNNEFHAFMGPQNLVEGIRAFLKWFEDAN